METIKEPNTQLQVASQFDVFRNQAQEWLEKAKEINVTDVSQVELMEGAKKARLALRGIRIAVANKHSELKEESLRYGQSLDKAKRELTALIEPIEAHLQEQEDFKKVQEEKVRKEIFTKRAIELEPFMSKPEILALPLADMSEEAFSNLLNGLKMVREKKLKDEADLKAANEKKEKDAEDERKRLADQNKKLQEILKKEQADKKKLEDEATALRQKEEDRKKKEAADKRKAARAPDKEKLEALTRTLYDVAGKFPKMNSEEGEAIIEDCKTMIGKMVAHINKKIEQL